MKEAKKISKRFGIWVIVFTILLLGLIYFISNALAVSAERGNFVILGRAEENELVDEMVDLWAEPDVKELLRVKIKSGTVTSVLEKVMLETGNYYLVSTVGRDGGMIGWVSEEYIYEITSPPPLE